MTSVNIFKYVRIIIAAFLALLLSRMGVSYLWILVAIGVILSILSKSKSEPIIAGVLYSTLSYILTYHSGFFLIQYMPNNASVQVSAIDVYINLFMGWLVPALIAIIICGLTSFIGMAIWEILNKNESKYNSDAYYFDDEKDLINQDRVIEDSFNQKDYLYLSPIERAKRRKNFNNRNEDEKI